MKSCGWRRSSALSLLITAAVAHWAAVPAALAHDPYSSWTQPGTGKSCCNDRDCRPVRSYLGDDGIHYILLVNRWRPVPPDRVLRIPSPDGASHACVNDETEEIHCFVSGQPKS